MTREEKQKAIDALKISTPIMAMTQEKFNDYIQTLNKVMDWLEQEPTTKNDSSELEKNSKKLEKNFGELDCISRAEVLKAMDTWDKFGYTETGCFVRKPKGDYVPYVKYDDMVNCVKGTPSVTPQEPFKPMVEIDLYSVIKQKYIEREVLNKIRAEIDNALSDGMIHKKTVLGIIDKYNAESEKNMSKHWIDDADHWICPDCGFITPNPNRYEGCKCPKCGFQDAKDRADSEAEDGECK